MLSHFLGFDQSSQNTPKKHPRHKRGLRSKSELAQRPCIGRELAAVDSGQWTVDSGQWTVDSGQWTVDSGQWTVDSGQWAVGSGQWAVSSRQLCSRASANFDTAASWLGLSGCCATRQFLLHKNLDSDSARRKPPKAPASLNAAYSQSSRSPDCP